MRELDFASRKASAELPEAVVVEAFARTMALAEATAGATQPNPPVACAALDEQGAMLACEAHQRAGAAHAEAAALEAGRRQGVFSRIHTLVVTLEPCNHHDRTPPCTEAILASPARAVWIGARDPNPKVCGGAAARLMAEGLKVRFLDQAPHPVAAELARRARRLIAPFAAWSRTGRPWVTLKQAFTAQGSMIPPSGRKTFTSPEALVLAHRLRRRADAIITGSGCVLADDPAFTVRHVSDHPGKRRILAILDRRGRTPPAYVEAAQARGFDVRIRDDLKALLDELGEAGVLEALVEAGPTLSQAMLAGGLWDEQVVIRQGPPGAPAAVEVRARRAAD
ncbi:MAG: bifunctional diaminohydroxyphosphoribosylaminopyrimidine deaminase/5-amino-6-(5-phosphoribosylamino)uracil reductase RibD [Caulobacteraceae bacterium]|nr:bifunctional diaminohydroxyphosphoribosylaminopyrimidine deaminase/5-amino-6-(5-phosphoribosylamino)uracil reductase RibD [Caulobacteraceae bacterium]